jgi:sugar/nucleoside kinase (ribokinase family)
LLSLAKKEGAFCVASFLGDEAEEFAQGGGIQNTDLLVINEDEAAAFLGRTKDDPQRLVSECYQKVKEQNQGALLAVTFGPGGSYLCENNQLVHLPAMPVQVVATGGAGDAFVAGTVCGLVLGLPFLPGSGPSATQLGASLAAESITKLDTIADSIDRAFVMEVLNKMTAGEDSI